MLSAAISFLVPLQLVNYGLQWVPDWGWRLSLGLAAVPALVLLMGGLILPESPSSLVERCSGGAGPGRGRRGGVG